MRTQDGLLDVIALGCVLEFATALRSDRYGADYDPSSASVAADLQQENLARTWFRVIMKTFASKFFTVIEGTIVHASYIWESVMVGFAAAVITHMRAKHDDVEQVPGRGPEEVAMALYSHVAFDHPHLLEPLHRASAETPARTSLTWNGPAIQIKRKTPAFYPMLRAIGVSEELDWEGFPLRLEGTSRVMNKYYAGGWRAEA